LVFRSRVRKKSLGFHPGSCGARQGISNSMVFPFFVL
jgi:hypothetical protein